MAAVDPVDPGGPDEGHSFVIAVCSRGSYREKNEQVHHDADWWGEPWTVTVRSWSLSDALRKAADLRLVAWDMDLDGEAED